MALNPEWRKRIEHWRAMLPERFFRPLSEIPLSGFLTYEFLNPEQAAEGDFQPMPPGTEWGAKWQYGWFKAHVVVPEEAAGQRLEVRLEPGGESFVLVNGKAAGAVDRQHTTITLAREAKPGDTYDILVESYGGHGATPCGEGPVPFGKLSVPEPPATQRTVGTSELLIADEPVYQLFMDIQTLWHLREAMDDRESLRLSQIDDALKEMTTVVDLELPHEEFIASVEQGRQCLASALEATNGSIAPRFYAHGHAHIDTAWLWPLDETRRKCLRTFATQLALIDEYPEYKFLCSQPHQYRWVMHDNPELYRRITEAVKAGNWIAEGGMWIEADTNVSGGEALIRQFIHGKRFFADEFGIDNELLWLPDVFGYSGALPQIMRGCGIKYFSTQKIFWVYGGGDPFPYNTFTWEGIDGSEVLAHIHNDYNARTSPADLIGRWSERRQKDGLYSRLFPFGYGDGGGGATRTHLEYLRRTGDLQDCPKTSIDSPLAFFTDLEENGYPDDRYVGELYFQCHRGTYTSQAKTKKGNRKGELALREAEMWASAAMMLSNDYAPPAEILDEAWKLLLLNQFHDILPGSSIHRVYEEAEADYAQILTAAGEVTDAALGALVDSGKSVVVFNSLSWQRDALIEVPAGQGMVDAEGTALPIQPEGGRMLAEVKLPACGWTTLSPSDQTVEIDKPARATDRCLENDLIKVSFDAFGRVISIFDKKTRRELTTGPCNEFRMFKDVPNMFDAWDIDSNYTLMPIPLEDKAQIEVAGDGPLVARLRITRQLNASTMTQVVSLRRGSRRVDFDTTIEWTESHKLLKVAFPVDYRSEQAIHEIQFGHLRRPTHSNRPFDFDQFEVANYRWTALAEETRGFAVLNDCKYGVDVADHTISLTLLKSALAPDMTADKGTQQFTYAMYCWNGGLAESGLVRQGYELNVEPRLTTGQASRRSLFAVDVDNVIIETVKPAEDGSGDVVVRLYEAMRSGTRCTLTTTLPVQSAAQTDMLEQQPEPLELSNSAMTLEFRPFEIKTIRLGR